MSRPFIKGGTPVGNVSLCRTCTNAHIITGFRESEQVIFCTDVHPSLRLQFPVHECTGYYDKNRPNWDQMEKLAIHVVPGPLKPVGFKFGVRPSSEEEDDD